MTFTTPPQTPRGKDSTPPKTPDQPIERPDPTPLGVTRQNWLSRPVNLNLGFTGPCSFLVRPEDP
jgi:hypothetical protein